VTTPSLALTTVLNVGAHRFELLGYHCRDLFVNLIPCVGGWLVQGFSKSDIECPECDAPAKMYWTQDGKWVEQVYVGPGREAPDGAVWSFDELARQLPLAVAAAKEAP
jgi:hypothetical protein